MSQVYSIVAIVGFSFAGVLAVCAVAMFFGLQIKQVHDSLTGKTAARSIAEIRARAKTRKRSASDAAQRLGWNGGIASGDLAGFADGEATHAAHNFGKAETPTSFLADDDCEASTSLLAESKGETRTTLLASSNVSDEPLTGLLVDDDGERS